MWGFLRWLSVFMLPKSNDSTIRAETGSDEVSADGIDCRRALRPTAIPRLPGGAGKCRKRLI
jgi:hypothetical protein